jgi:hypothetical protein
VTWFNSDFRAVKNREDVEEKAYTAKWLEREKKEKITQ